MRILLIEDDLKLAKLISTYLTRQHHLVEQTSDGDQGLDWLLHRMYDVAIIDWMLPHRSGPDICAIARAADVNAGLLLLTARGDIDDRITGLRRGADDYLTKPFSVLELTARVKAMLRRADLAKAAIPSEHTRRIMSGELVIDEAAHEVRLRGQIVGLTSKEFDLLFHLARHPGRAFTRAQLLDAIWGTTFEGYEHNVNTHINRLRSKIEVDPANPVYVLTVRGLGYRFTDQR
jgi:DNA-binding response OmpR family regulator